jgi:hypothetical protein
MAAEMSLLVLMAAQSLRLWQPVRVYVGDVWSRKAH